LGQIVAQIDRLGATAQYGWVKPSISVPFAMKVCSVKGISPDCRSFGSEAGGPALSTGSVWETSADGAGRERAN